MPTYSYECKECEHLFDVFHPMSSKPRIKCEECGSRCRRLIGPGAGIIFKGSGFYETDYKRSNGAGDKSKESSEKTESSATSDSPAKSGESGKSESKSTGATSSGASSSSSSSGD